MNLQSISQAICRSFQIMSYSLSAVAEFVSYVAHKNYEIMSNVFYYVYLIVSTIFCVLENAFGGVLYILQHIVDFATDLFGCFCTLCTLVWKILLLIYKVVCFILTGIETLAVCLWTGSYVTLTTLKHSATDVIETCGSTWNYGVDMSMSFADTIVGGFAMIGTLSVSLVKGIFNGLGYGFASLLECVWNLTDQLCNGWANLTSNISGMFTFSKEAYLGILLCLTMYMMLSKLFGYFQQHGLSFSSWWRRLTRRRRPRGINNLYDIDNEFESDFEHGYESEEYVSEGESVTEGSDEGDSDRSSDDDDDNSDDEDESEGSLNSQTFSSDESDNEIEVQLPSLSDRYNLRSRSSTPNRPKKIDMSSHDYEVEIEKEKDKRKCVVCQDQTKSVLILPCRHMCLCIDCANHIVRSRLIERRVCPLCRQRIQKVMDVYV